MSKKEMKRKKGEGKKPFSWSKPLGYHQDTNIWLYFSSKLTYFFSHQVCLTLCNLMDQIMPGLLVLHCLLEFAQTHVY